MIVKLEQLHYGMLILDLLMEAYSLAVVYWIMKVLVVVVEETMILVVSECHLIEAVTLTQLLFKYFNISLKRRTLCIKKNVNTEVNIKFLSILSLYRQA